jgi:hypothetical protein
MRNAPLFRRKFNVTNHTAFIDRFQEAMSRRDFLKLPLDSRGKMLYNSQVITPV